MSFLEDSRAVLQHNIDEEDRGSSYYINTLSPQGCYIEKGVTMPGHYSHFRAVVIMMFDGILSKYLNYFNKCVEESESEFVCMTEYIRADDTKIYCIWLVNLKVHFSDSIY